MAGIRKEGIEIFKRGKKRSPTDAAIKTRERTKRQVKTPRLLFSGLREVSN